MIVYSGGGESESGAFDVNYDEESFHQQASPGTASD